MGGADVGGIVGVLDSSSSSLGGVLSDAAVGQPEPNDAPAGEGVGKGVRRDGGRERGKTERK